MASGKIKKKFIEANAVGSSEILLENNAPLRARNASNDADINVIKVNALNSPEFLSKTIHPFTPTAGSDIVNKDYVDGFVSIQFETVSKNLKSWSAVFNYTADELTSIVYTNGVQTITKTLIRTSGSLTSIVLSGDTPSGINLTKTFSYSGDTLSGVAYS